MSYRWAGHDEWMLVQEGGGGPHLLIVQPLFGELNRTRRLLRDAMRGLARRGIAGSLPDLPGTGESPRLLADCNWDDWTGGLAAAASAVGATHVASVRGGALLDHAAGAATPRWRLSPVDGAALLRDLARAQAIGEREGGAADPAELAGYRLSPDLAARLAQAEPDAGGAVRTLRIEGEPRPADAHLPGPAPWRRAEPGASPALAEAIAGDLAAWIGACGG